MNFPTLEHWQKRAAELYEKTRDLNKPLAEIEFSKALMDAYTEGAEAIHETVKFVRTPNATETKQ